MSADRLLVGLGGGARRPSAAAAKGGGKAKKKLSPKCVITGQPSDIFCVRFAPDSTLCASGCGDGAIRIYNSATGRKAFELNADFAKGNLPVTCLRFRPEGSSNKTRNILIAASADGGVRHWHVATGKCLNDIHEEDNEVYAVDYRPDGGMFATAGRDFKIRLYDEATKMESSQLSGGATVDSAAGHANRVFSLKFNPTDPNILISGGWDNTIQLWDTRMDHAVRSIFGPHICGDAVDVYEDTVLSGSWRADAALQLWDYGSGKLKETIAWGGDPDDPPCMLYSAQFSPDAQFIVAGGSGLNEAKVFETKTQRLVGRIDGMEKGVYSTCFSPSGQFVAVGAGDNSLRLSELRDAGGPAPA